jgi:hypothetical protein
MTRRGGEAGGCWDPRMPAVWAKRLPISRAMQVKTGAKTANLWTTQDLESVKESCSFPASALSRLLIKRPFLAAHGAPPAEPGLGLEAVPVDPARQHLAAGVSGGQGVVPDLPARLALHPHLRLGRS